MTNQTPNNTQQIVIEFVAKTSDALKKWSELDKKADEVKQKLKEMGEQGVPLREAAAALKLTTAEEGKKNIENLKQALKSMQDTLQTNKKLTNEQSNQLKASIADVTRTLKEEGQAGKEAGIAIAQGQQRAKEEAKGLQDTIGGAGGISSTFKNALSFAGALVGITSLASVLQKIFGLLVQATEYSLSFAKSMFSMNVAIRALQRAGVEVTFSEMTSQIELLKNKFGVFSRKDLVEGAAAFLNLNRDMGFTKEQLFELQEAIATLAIVNGRSMDEVQKTVALALSSGYTEGLQRLGVSINRVTIAEEAARLGWDKGYTALNEQQRSLATFNLVIRKTAIYQEDLLEYQRTLPGQIDATTKAIEDQTVKLGENTNGWKLWWLQVQLGYFKFFTGISTLLNSDAMYEFQQNWMENQKKLLGDAYKDIENQLYQYSYSLWMEGVNQGLSVQDIFEKYNVPSPTYNPALLTDTGALKTDTQMLMDKIAAAVETNLDDMIALQEDFQDRSTELWDEYQKDVQDIWEEHWKKEKEIFDDFATDYLEAQKEHEEKVIENRDEHWKREEEIQKQHLDNEKKAQDDYDKSVVDTWRQYNSNLTKAQETYRNREKDAEEKFQEQMRKLREGFLMDLEEAVRQRDARQVMTLIKRYNLDRKQSEREYDLERKQAWRDYQQQLVDLARQRDERLAQLYEELQARFDALDEELKAELAKEEERNKEAEDKEQKSWDKRRTALADDYAKRSTDEDTANAERITKRDEAYQEDLDALGKWLDDRAKVIGENLATAVSLTDTQMGLMEKALNDTLGKGGVADGIFDHFIQKANEAATAAVTAFTYMQYIPMISPPGSLPSTTPTPDTRHRRAKGGIDYAETSTDVTFGEAGPELAMFIPLSRSIQGLGSLISSVNFGTGQVSKQSRAAVEISLAPGLEGRIVDTAADVMADVIIRRLR